MPFRSKKQEIFMRLNHPDIYKRWKRKYGSYSGSKRRKPKRKNRRK